MFVFFPLPFSFDGVKCQLKQPKPTPNPKLNLIVQRLSVFGYLRIEIETEYDLSQDRNW